MNLRKFERIAAELEKQLGIDAPGDELIDEAESIVSDGESDHLGDTIDEQIVDEKAENPVPPEALSADDESDDVLNEIDDFEKSLDKQEASAPEEPAPEAPAPEEPAPEAPAPEAPAPEALAPEEPVTEPPTDDATAKACIASMQKLVKIAKAVKISKDMPATKKAEILSKIQKTSENLINAVTNYNKSKLRQKKSTTPGALKSGLTPDAVAKLLDNPNMKISELFVGDNKFQGNYQLNDMTTGMFVNLLTAIENVLKQKKDKK